MKEKEIKDNELETVNGGMINDEELVIPEKLKVVDQPAFSAVEPVIIIPEYEKKTEKDTFVPILY